MLNLSFNYRINIVLALDFQLPAEMFAANIQAAGREVYEVAVERTSFLQIWWCAEILAVEAPRLEPASHGTR